MVYCFDDPLIEKKLWALAGEIIQAQWKKCGSDAF